MSAQYLNARNLKERILVQGKLVLVTPTHLGTGDTDSPIDMPLIRDPLEGRALLTGATIAGALRNYLHLQNPRLAETLFGSVSTTTSRESYLVIDDAIGNKPGVEFRDGVAIDPQTRTAADKKKFDYELLEAGTSFNLQFELLVPQNGGTQLVEGLAVCLTALEEGEIRLGKRKRRGFGRCQVTQWAVQRFDMTQPQGMFAWLEYKPGEPVEGEGIARRLLGRALTDAERAAAQQRQCNLTIDVCVDGSILIRADAGSDSGPDFVHLHSGGNPVVSGTSLAGALRQRVVKIANTLDKPGREIANILFGNYAYHNESDMQLTASRVWVDETAIANPVNLVQSRIKIDRLTGSTFQEALFSEQPVFGKGAQFRIHIRLEDPKKWEVGLLLLLLKDIWMGDLTIGGESSVGRGQLKGLHAELKFAGKTWIFQAGDGKTVHVSGTDAAQLQTFVDQFHSMNDFGGHHE